MIASPDSVPKLAKVHPGKLSQEAGGCANRTLGTSASPATGAMSRMKSKLGELIGGFVAANFTDQAVLRALPRTRPTDSGGRSSAPRHTEIMRNADRETAGWRFPCRGRRSPIERSLPTPTPTQVCSKI